MTTTQHRLQPPLPWHYAEGAIMGDQPHSLYNRVMTVPIPFDDVERRNMDFLIRAVNSHDALLEALKACMEADGWTSYPEPGDFDNLTKAEIKAWTLARKAISLAEGG